MLEILTVDDGCLNHVGDPCPNCYICCHIAVDRLHDEIAALASNLGHRLKPAIQCLNARVPGATHLDRFKANALESVSPPTMNGGDMGTLSAPAFKFLRDPAQRNQLLF